MIQSLGDNLIPVMGIGCTFLFFITWVIMATIDSIYKTRCNTQLKQRLIERGSSASEIDQILRAGVPGNDQSAANYTAPMPPVKSQLVR